MIADDDLGHGARSPRSAGAVPVHELPRAALLEHLERSAQQIVERAPSRPDPAVAEREKAVVHECRYLMRLLANRQRSAGEMRQALRRREVPADIAHEVMARIDRSGLIDDPAFAGEWVRQRRRLRSLSDEALRRELEQREVADDVIAEALAVDEDGDDGEESRCRELVRSRLRDRDREQLRDDRDGSHRRRLSRRLDAMLTRKGYPGSLAVRVISSELRDAARGD
ncbi:regulatory protein RecX [Brachybacterium sp. DNPG3]